MKKKIIASLFVITALVVIALLTGCNKTTGGGAFTADETSSSGLPGHFCTFGFNAQPVNQPYPGYEGTIILAKGNLQFVDHTNKTNIKGDFQGTWKVTSSTNSQFAGLCTIDKKGSYAFGTTFTDNGPGQQDYVSLVIVDNGLDNLVSDVQNNVDIIYQYDGTLDPGSDIVVHTK